MLRGGEGVAEEMRKLDDLTCIIADSMNEMASGTVQISNAVQDVNEIIQKNKASIDNLAKEVKSLRYRRMLGRCLVVRYAITFFTKYCIL